MRNERTTSTQANRAADPREETTAPASNCSEAISVYHRSRKPIPLEDLAAAAGIRLEERVYHPCVHGFYAEIPVGTGSRMKFIVVNAAKKRRHRAFVFGHELAHAAHHAAGNRPDLCQGDGLATRGIGRNLPGEQLCDRLAAELLMPADLVVRSVFGAGRVRPYALAREFDVTIATARTRLRGLGLL